MATQDSERGGETGNGRLQSFISSIFASIGGVFSQYNNQEQEEDLQMDNKTVVVPHNLPKG